MTTERTSTTPIAESQRKVATVTPDTWYDKEPAPITTPSRSGTKADNTLDKDKQTTDDEFDMTSEVSYAKNLEAIMLASLLRISETLSCELM